jgi:hypothetical protein
LERLSADRFRDATGVRLAVTPWSARERGQRRRAAAKRGASRDV